MSEGRFLALVLAFEFPLHSQSAFNPSVFTIRKFASISKEDRKSLMEGLNISLVMNLAFSWAMYGIDPFAGMLAFIISVGVYFYYYGLISRVTYGRVQVS